MLWGLGAAVIFTLPVSAQSVVNQSSTGYCSPNINNVTGNVTFNCTGIPEDLQKRIDELFSLPKTINRINRRLDKLEKNNGKLKDIEFQLEEQTAKINEWIASTKR